MTDGQENNKRKVQKRKEYTQDDVLAAVVAYQNRENLSLCEIAKAYHIPKTTLANKINGKYDMECNLGRPTCLTTEQENLMVTRLIDHADRGFPITIDDLREFVYLFCERMGIKHPFNKLVDLKAGRKFMKLFLSRHPIVAIRTPENLSRFRALSVSPEIVKAWFDGTKPFLERLGVLGKAWVFVNADESGFTLVPDPPKKVLAAKGRKNIPKLSSGERGQLITVIAAVSATGYYWPPFVIHNRQRLHQHHMEGYPTGTTHHQTDNAWIDTSGWGAFIDHLIKHRPQWLENEVIVLFVDGHRTHVYCPETLELAVENNVQIICLPAHCTNTLQPLDKRVFGPLKRNYKTVCHKFLSRGRGNILAKEDFGPLFNEAWIKTTKVETAINSFRVCGIYPFNFDAVPQLAFKPSEIFHPAEDNEESEELPSTSGENMDMAANQVLLAEDYIFNMNQNPSVGPLDPIMSLSDGDFFYDMPEYPSPPAPIQPVQVWPHAPVIRMQPVADTTLSTPQTPLVNSVSHPLQTTPAWPNENVAPPVPFQPALGLVPSMPAAIDVLNEVMPCLKKGDAKGKGARKRFSVMSAGGVLTSPEHIQHAKNVAEKSKARASKKNHKSARELKSQMPVVMAKKEKVEDEVDPQWECCCGIIYDENNLVEDWVECRLCGTWEHQGCGTATDTYFYCSKCEIPQ